MKRLLGLLACSIFIYPQLVVAGASQADINIDFGRFAGFWVYEGCEKENVKSKCWFVIEKKKELYGDQEYFSYANQRVVPAKVDALERLCGEFKYTTGFTVTNLPNKAICIKVIGAGDKAELYYPVGYAGYGTYKIVKSSKEQFMKRVDERSKKLLKDTNW